MRNLAWFGVGLSVVLLLVACGETEGEPAAIATTTAATTTTTPTTTPATTTTTATTPATTTTATTTTTLPFPDRLRPDIAAFNVLVACLEEHVAEMDVAALISAIASELVVYRATTSIDPRFFELENGFLRCLPELPDYAAARIELGQALEGMLDHPDDIDVFVFQATQDQIYQIRLHSATLRDPIVNIYDKDETELGGNDYPTDLPLLWKAPAAGDYYVAVEGYAAGSYTVTVEQSDVVDDHPDRIDSEASRVSAGGSATGVIDFSDDADFFALDAVEGEIYRIATNPPNLGLAVYDASEIDLAWGYWGEPVSLKASETGTLYIAVSGTTPGAYTLTMDTLEDDYPDTGEGAFPIEPGRTVTGALDYHPADVDVFVFHATEDQVYQITVDLGTLRDSTVAVYDPDGNQLAWNDDADSLASQLVWQPPATGDYHIYVSGYGTGTYTLTIQPTTE